MRLKRQIIHRIGDTCAEDYGGGALVRIGPHLYIEYTHGAEGEGEGFPDRYSPEIRNATLEVYRVDVPRGTKRGDLCDPAAILADLSWVGDDWSAVAACVGCDPWEMIEIATDPSRAWALYEIVAAYWGWREIDHEPMRIPYKRVERMWRGMDARARETRRAARKVAREGGRAA